MRSILFAVLALAACQRADSAELSAKVVAEQSRIAPKSPVTPSATALAAIAPQAKQETGCGQGGKGCGGSCGGDMGAGGCTGGVTEMPTWAALPADAQWTDLKVAGMHCGGCARRIEKRLASVDGVLGVKIDVASGQVKVATAKGIDARSIAKPAIDEIGYSVQ